MASPRLWVDRLNNLLAIRLQGKPSGVKRVSRLSLRLETSSSLLIDNLEPHATLLERYQIKYTQVANFRR